MDQNLIFLLVILVVLIIYSIKNKHKTTSGSPRPGGFYKNSSLSAAERRLEYRRRGKSPSGVIDGVYNDMYRENGKPYSDVDRDWDADA